MGHSEKETSDTEENPLIIIQSSSLKKDFKIVVLKCSK